MRLVHLIPSLIGGGAEHQLTHLAGALAAAGHETHVAFVFRGVYLDHLARSGCALHELRASRACHPLLPVQTLSLLGRLRPDVAHTWLTHMDVGAGPSAALLGIPWVMSERSSARAYPPSPINRLRLAAGSRATLIAANSPGGVAYWRSNGVDGSRVELVPNYVPIGDIRAASAIDDGRLAGDDEVILHMARLSPEKNAGVLVRAFPDVVRARPRARLVFCGDGPLSAPLAAQAAALGLRDRVLFADFVPDPARWLKRASAVVTVSSFEGCPGSVLEAMAAGIPLIVSDIGAHRALLSDAAALFVADDDPRAVATAIVDTLRDRAAADARAARARAGLADRSLQDVTNAYLRVYEKAIALAGDRSAPETRLAND